ncbi:hypothetical protein PMZ80_002019 [Knufia obscura]|uniref:DUF300-domain-containing protein n=2 Tax=Knufia TaxID=430999 RepID=A0AAN8EU99_9EURO|nr:hypothetical protein PMZ80_002019 [Knufia obscura]KAK5953836.1 hypothetical protein OHC33_005106 [Knufia fluminis]
MGWPQCNSTLEDLEIKETPLFDSHDFSFHKLSIAMSAIFAIIALVISLFLMFMHTIRYSRPIEQRHILRILFMVPVYALVSFLSIVFYTHSVYYEVLRDCYEAFAIASFFSLMCAYIAPDLHHQKEYFRKIKPKGWIWPMRWFQKCAGGEHGWLRTPRSGLTWFNVIWVAVFQYCFVRVAMTITAVVTQYFNRYCLESLNPAFSHIWVMVIEGVAVTITMYCIIQFYVQIRADISQHKPILKVLAIKLVIFLSFWQTILISFLTSSGAIHASNKIQTPDIKVGIPSMLLCIEMALFSIFHLWSFSYRPYVIGSKQHQDTYGHLKETETPRYHGGPLGIKALFDAFNPWDLIKATGRSAKWLFRDRKHRTQDASYITVADVDGQAQKMSVFEASTAYTGAVGAKIPARPVNPEEGSGLLYAAQVPAQSHTQLNPFATRESDSSSTSPWTEVEAKEYFQDTQMRRTDPRVDQFQTVPLHSGQQQQQQSTPYNARYHETQNYNQTQNQNHNFSRPISRPGQPLPPALPPSLQVPIPTSQHPGVLRPAGTTPLSATSPAGQSPDLPMPMVTRRDIEDMQYAHRTYGQGQQFGGNVGVGMPPLPPRNQNSRPGGGGGGGGGYM